MQMTSIPGPHIVSVAESEENGDGVGNSEDGNDIGNSEHGNDIGDSEDGNDIGDSEHASMKAHAGDPSVASVERSTIIQANANTQHTPVNLQVYDYAINEAANVIDQLGWETKKTHMQVTTQFTNRAASQRTSKHSPPSLPFLRPTPRSFRCFWRMPSGKHRYRLDSIIQQNQDIFVLLEGKKTVSTAKLKVSSQSP